MNRFYAAFVICLVIQTTASVDAGNWPRYRGPDGSGHSEANIPVKWDASAIKYRVELPGTGQSSPIVWGDQIIVTTALSEGKVEPPKKGLYFGGERPSSKDTHHWKVISVSLATGNVQWSTTVQSGLPHNRRVHEPSTWAYAGN